MRAEVTRVFEQLGEPFACCANMIRLVFGHGTRMEVVVKGAAAALPDRVVIYEAKFKI